MRRPRLALAAASLGLLASPLAAAYPSNAHEPLRASEPPAAMLGIHVVHPLHGSPYLADASGRQVMLRGVDTNALVQYSDQPGCSFQETVPLTSADLSEMAALGFDFLRLAVSWSRLEPAPGKFSGTYIDEVSRVVNEARAHGIAVLVDMHQDRYNRHTWCGQEVDGAPDWATLTYGTPCTPVEISTLCAQAATQAFWSDARVAGKGLQAWYLGALGKLAAAVGHASNLAGIEIMNEPTPGFVAPGAFETTELYPFYRRMIKGLVHSGFTKPIWFEPSSLRDVTDNALASAVRFSSYPQLVYAVHIYTGVFSYPQGPDNTEAQLRQSYMAARAEARVFGTPWVDDEFGSNASAAWDLWLRRELALQNNYMVGSGFWLWKQQPGFYGWAVVHPDGTLRTSTERAQLLSLPHVDAAPGRLLSIRLLGPGPSDAVPLAPSALSVSIFSPRGGTMLLWSGTVVDSGGPSLLAEPFTRAAVNGKVVPSTCKKIVFQATAPPAGSSAGSSAGGSTGGSAGGSGSPDASGGTSARSSRSTELAGCTVEVKVPRGFDTVVMAGSTRW